MKKIVIAITIIIWIVVIVIAVKKFTTHYHDNHQIRETNKNAYSENQTSENLKKDNQAAANQIDEILTSDAFKQELIEYLNSEQLMNDLKNQNVNDLTTTSILITALGLITNHMLEYTQNLVGEDLTKMEVEYIKTQLNQYYQSEDFYQEMIKSSSYQTIAEMISDRSQTSMSNGLS